MELERYYPLSDPGWYHNWILTVCVSFIGTFGQMEIYMPYTVSKLYMLFFAVGIISVFFVKETFDLRKNVCCTVESSWK